MSVSFIIAIIISAKNEDSSFKNYVFVRKEEYKALQEHSLEQEYENMKQEVEISTLKVRLSSIKLRLKILKKIFKHKKIIKLRKLGKTNNESFSLKKFHYIM